MLNHQLPTQKSVCLQNHILSKGEPWACGAVDNRLVALLNWLGGMLGYADFRGGLIVGLGKSSCALAGGHTKTLWKME